MAFGETTREVEDRRAVVYRRVSSESQKEDGSSLQRDQVRICAQLAATHKLTVVESFEEAASAKTGRSSKREVFHKELLPYIEANGIRNLVLANTDRLSRDGSLRVRGEILGWLQEHHVIVYSPQGVLDLETPSGRLLMLIMSELAAAENERRAGGVREARQGAFEQGIYHSGTVPFGYRLVAAPDLTPKQAALFDVPPGVKPPSFLLPFDAEVVLLRSVIDRLLAGESAKAIAQGLNAEGIPQNVHKDTPSWWNSQSIRKMVLAPVRRGMVTRGGRVANAVNVVPIIDEPTYYSLAAHMQATARKDKAKGGRDTVLGGLLRCAECGAIFWRIPVSGRSKKYLYYMCSRSRGHRGCDAPRISQEAALAGLGDLLPALLSPRLFKEQTLRGEIEAASIERELELVEGEIAWLFEARATPGRLDDEDFQRRYDEMRPKRNALKARLAAVVPKFRGVEPGEIDHLLHSDQARLHTLLTAIVDYIEVDKGQLRRMVFKLGAAPTKDVWEYQSNYLEDRTTSQVYCRFDEVERLREIIWFPEGFLAGTRAAVDDRNWDGAVLAATIAFSRLLGPTDTPDGRLCATLLWMGQWGELPPGAAYKQIEGGSDDEAGAVERGSER